MRFSKPSSDEKVSYSPPVIAAIALGEFFRIACTPIKTGANRSGPAFISSVLLPRMVSSTFYREGEKLSAYMLVLLVPTRFTTWSSFLAQVLP